MMPQQSLARSRWILSVGVVLFFSCLNSESTLAFETPSHDEIQSVSDDASFWSPDQDQMLDAPFAPQRRGRRGGVYKANIAPNWFADDQKFWYRNDLPKGESEYILVDAKAGKRDLAFDHDKLAEALSAAEIKSNSKQLRLSGLRFVEDGAAIVFATGGKVWHYELSSNELTEAEGDNAKELADETTLPNVVRRRPSGGSGEETSIVFENKTSEVMHLFWVSTSGENVAYGSVEPNERHSQHTFAGHIWEVKDAAGKSLAVFVADTTLRPARVPAPNLSERRQSARGRSGQQGRRGQGSRFRGFGGRSPDGKWNATVKDNNVVIENTETEEERIVTTDGSEDSSYTMLQWAPDSSALVAFQMTPGDQLEVHLVESSPDEGGRAVLHSRRYPLPGDRFNSYAVRVINPESGEVTKPVDEPIDFGFPRLHWRKDGHSFAYEKVDRGHQRYRLIQVDTHTGEATNLIDEQTDTFVWTAHRHDIDVAIATWLEESEAIIHSSEKDGWRQLYYLDLEAESPSLQRITEGEFVVRGVDRIDEEKQQIWFRASGLDANQDPYFIHYCRINFDGSGFTRLTEGNGTHNVTYSPTGEFLIDTYSRVDEAPIHELRRTADGSLVCELERADITELVASGWKAPEVFVSKARDGETDIWGIICRPTDFDPSKKYPVIEDIYAGPHGSFVPKSFSPSNRYESLTRLGFIVAKVDGMGTANRSKAFHDVCWHNIKDAGFPDRILWHHAIAKKYDHYDVSRVGIYGTSAGGQNSTAGMLFHPDFYKVAVSACGCHDNRMDKASWNEQWMGYPVEQHYSASSNIDNAAKLQGKLLLIVGEMDTNVPPESTYRLVDALIKANKDFDFLMVPGGGHGMGGAYGSRKMHRYFVDNLLSMEPEEQSDSAAASAAKSDVSFVTTSGNSQLLAATIATKQEEQAAESQELDLESAFSLPPESNPARDLYEADRGSLERFYSIEVSPRRHARMRAYYSSWARAVEALDLENYSEEAQKDLKAILEDTRESMRELNVIEQEVREVADILPFAEQILALAEARQRVEEFEAEQVAAQVSEMINVIEELTAELTAEADPVTDAKYEVAVRHLENLTTWFKEWHGFYNEYDPIFTWWLEKPFERALEAIDSYSDELKKRVPSEEKDDDKITSNLAPADQAPQLTSNERKQVVARLPLRGRDALAIAWNPSTQGTEDAPDLEQLLAIPPSRMQPIIEEFNREMFRRRGRGRFGRGGRRGNDEDAPAPPTPEQRLERFKLWETRLSELPYDEMEQHERVDYQLLLNRIRAEQKRIEYAIKTQDDEPVMVTDESGIQGTPIGREALMIELQSEMIPYTPEELVEIAEQEYLWCQAELKKAANEMGFGDDWRAAVEKVKRMHVRPGEQPIMIRDLAHEATDYLIENNLLTVPPIAAETWRMQMMTPQRQLVNPFFTGGEVISVSFPTSTMTHDDKLQSLRGNNIPFAMATVHHELIPGHHLQMFLNARNRTYRRGFNTPFWLEGWALYWEFILYNRGFPPTPEDRVGFLVWRSHRCARIVFSLNFHLGRMTPKECVDLLVARVGFERKNAEAEVRRSVGRGYGPLYQAAYMLGGIQFRSLHREFVDSGMMTDQEFHDAILQENSIPVTMVRAILKGDELPKDAEFNWRFYDDQFESK